jgi:hypothetical protein
MAADKEIMKALETLRLDRPGRVYAAAQQGPQRESLGAQLISTLTELAATFREEAGLWAKSGARGWKSSEGDAYLAAQRVDEVTAQLDNAGGGAALSVSNHDGRLDDVEQALRESAKRIDAVTDLAGLDKLIADSVAQRKGHVRDELLPNGHPARSDAPTLDEINRDIELMHVAEGVDESAGDVVSAYLRGETNDIPGSAPLTPNSIVSAPEADDPFAPKSTDTPSLVGQLDETLQPAPPYCRDCDLDQHRCYGCCEPVEHGKYACAQCELIHADGPPTSLPKTWESEIMTADGHRPPGLAPLLGQPGDAGTGYSHSYIPAGGRRYTYAELLTPVPAASLPPHLSHSQGNTIGDCATKYRLQRIEALPQVPQWANVGGSAFHAAVESWERMAAKHPGISLNEEDCEQTWKYHFEGQINAIAATSPVPVSVWRASRKGAEGRQWWEVNGPLMLRRYLDARPAEPTAFLPAGSGVPSALGIEADITVDVPTPYGPLQFNAKIDRVTVADTETLIIRDYKTSYERPTDTTQLGDYAGVLLLSGAAGPHARILGTYFDARRGTWTGPVDLLDVHPFEAFQYRVTTAYAQRRALTTGPTPARPSSYCGGCSVRYACPIMAKAPAS